MKVHLFTRGDRRKKLAANIVELEDPELLEVFASNSIICASFLLQCMHENTHLTYCYERSCESNILSAQHLSILFIAMLTKYLDPYRVFHHIISRSASPTTCQLPSLQYASKLIITTLTHPIQPDHIPSPCTLPIAILANR